MNSTLRIGNIFQNNNVLDRYFNLIQSPLNKEFPINDEILLINNLNLNIANYKIYYPIILKELEKNELCTDLYNDFEQINDISMYIYSIIEEDMRDNVHLGTNLDLNFLYELLKFINNLLESFHKILKYKILFLNDNIKLEEYNKEYEKYLLKYGEQRTYFYTNIYQKEYEGLSENIRRVWKTEL